MAFRKDLSWFIYRNRLHLPYSRPLLTAPVHVPGHHLRDDHRGVVDVDDVMVAVIVPKQGR